MSESGIDIRSLSKAEVLAALYNAASPAGLGFAHEARAAADMTVVEARELLRGQTTFDYLYGRSCKIDLSSDLFDPWLYDRDNGGPGTAERIIDRLRATGSVSARDSTEHREAVTAQRAYEQPGYAELGEAVEPVPDEWRTLFQELVNDGIPVSNPHVTARRHLDWASDHALRYFDRGEYIKCVVLFVYLVGRHERTRWIANHPLTKDLLQIGIASRDRSTMERQMKGFAA